MKNFILSTVFVLTLIFNAQATTWYPSEATCPVCKTTGNFNQVGSYGGYIYQWETKFQYFYWPLTDDQSVYSCLKCNFTTFMWDFDSIPPDKTEEIKLILKDIDFGKKYDDYTSIPMHKRLEVAEKVYSVLGRDDDFWCRFYRVMGYHYESDQQTDNAKICRDKAKGLAEKMLTDTARSGQEKESYYIIACMDYFTGLKDEALVYLEKAGKEKYNNQSWEKENSDNLNDYLDDIISQYKEMILEEKKTKE
ncbi:MAG: hypothetical protein A2W91_15805 [Bacteroidetes bacterium GWF2_38_335]|nr:MAG: hypothetical protein A2W91_15805 [Bacteroidetes bacterium GWF2_38_335]HBS85270.1 hypothetical protein [Bacteroidales bacterium]